MAKNITITTANGEFTLTGTKRLTVKASGGNLVIDLGNGETKTYPLANVLGWATGAAALAGKVNRFEAYVKNATARLADALSSLRGDLTVEQITDEQLLLLARRAVEASNDIEAGTKKAAAYAVTLAKSKERRAAKKAATVEPASIIDPTFASDAALAALAAPKAAAVIAKVTKKSAKKSA